MVKIEEGEELTPYLWWFLVMFPISQEQQTLLQQQQPWYNATNVVAGAVVDAAGRRWMPLPNGISQGLEASVVPVPAAGVGSTVAASKGKAHVVLSENAKIKGDTEAEAVLAADNLTVGLVFVLLVVVGVMSLASALSIALGVPFGRTMLVSLLGSLAIFGLGTALMTVWLLILGISRVRLAMDMEHTMRFQIFPQDSSSRESNRSQSSSNGSDRQPGTLQAN